MSSPRRYLRGWWNHHRMKEAIASAEWQLGLALKNSVRLVPARWKGGYDCIYRARSRRRPGQTLASVRLNCPWQDCPPDEPALPRRPLPGANRITREATAYRVLSAYQLAPRLLVQSANFLANEWIPAARLSDVLRNDESEIWNALPVVLSAVRAMHGLGITHMDLNCGNILVDLKSGVVRLIDFEYTPVGVIDRKQREAFDVLRLIHNVMKPRRGQTEILRQPQRFVELIESRLPSGCGPLYREYGDLWFSRIQLCEDVRQSLSTIRRSATLNPL